MHRIGTLTALLVTWTISLLHAQEPTIQLPTVEIYGRRHAEFVLFGEKAHWMPKLRRPIQRPVGHKQEVNREKLVEITPKRTPELGQRAKANGRLALRAEYGSYTQIGEPYTSVGFSSQGGREWAEAGNAWARGEYFKSTGDRATGQGGHIEVTGFYKRSPKATLWGTVQASEGEQMLWGRPKTQDRDHWGRILSFGADLLPLLGLRGTLQTTLGAVEVKDEDRTDPVRENRTEIQIGSELSRNTMILRFGGTYRSLSRESGTIPRTDRLLSIDVLAIRSIGDRLNLGAGFQYSQWDSSKTQIREGLPQVLVELFPHQGLKLYARYAPRRVLHSFRALYENHPFLDPDVLPIFSKTDPHGVLGLRFLPASDWILQVEGELSRAIGIPIWTDPDADGLWTLERDRTVHIRSLSGALDYGALGAPLRLQASITAHQIEWLDTTTTLNVPYMPTIQGSIQATVLPIPGLRLSVRGTFVGLRYTTIASDDQVEGYVVLGAEVSKRLSGPITVYVRGENLLDQTYEIWKGYEMPGVGVYGGIEANW